MLGNYQEQFLSSLYKWSKKDYERQWHSAIDTLLRGGEKAALFTEYLGPEAGRLRWWKLYRVNTTVFFQEQILFYDQLAELFNLERAFDYIGDRQTITADGERISEWSVSLAGIVAFAATLK